MTRARNIAGFSTITTTPSPVHVGPIGVLTATRIDGEFNLVDLDTRDITAQGIGVTNLQTSGITTSAGLNVSGVGTIATLNVTGNATVGGVLTYEDVTNIDSIGIITARSGMVVSGVSTFSGALQSKGDVNPNAVFDRGSANTTNVNVNYNGTLTGQLAAANGDFQISAAGSSTPMSFYANGSERLRITSDGRLLLGTATANTSDAFTILDPGNAFMSLRSDAQADGNSQILDFAVGTGNRASSNLVSTITASIPTGATAGGTLKGYLAFSTNSGDSLSERLRITEDGELVMGTTSSNGARVVIQQNSSDTNPLDQATSADSSGVRIQNYSFGTGRYTALSLEACNSSSVQSASIIAQSASSGTSPTIIIAQRTSTSANTERLRINSDGNVLINTSATPTGYGNLNIFGTDNTSSRLAIRRGSADANGPQIWFNKSRNTTDGSHTVVQSGDILGSIVFTGNDSQGPEFSARIMCEVDNTPGSNDMPGRLVFSTTPDGSDTLAEALRLTSDKIVNIAGQGTVYGRLNVPIPTTSGGAAIQAMNTAGGSGDGTLTNVVLRSVNSTGSQWAHSQYRSQSHQFQVQTTNKVTINSNGLCFNTDTAAANALDDYEKGTWTPQMHDGNGSNVVLTVLSGRNVYVKIGELCYISGNVTLNDTGKSGVLVITHLPFNSYTEGQLAAGNWWVDHGSPSSGLGDIVGGVCYKTGNDAKIYFVNPTNGASNDSSNAEADTRYWEFSQWTNGRPVYFNLTYRTS